MVPGELNPGQGVRCAPEGERLQEACGILPAKPPVTFRKICVNLTNVSEMASPLRV